MKMVNMAMKAEKAEGKSDCCCCVGPCGCDEGKPRYPWGLQISLENEQLEALGILDMPKTGEAMSMTCVVKVTRCSEEDINGESPRRSMSLQITDMEMTAPEETRTPIDKEATAAALYGKAEG